MQYILPMCFIPPLPDSWGIWKHLEILRDVEGIIPELSNCGNVPRLNELDFQGGYLGMHAVFGHPGFSKVPNESVPIQREASHLSISFRTPGLNVR
jgi:hypothetical protein